MTRQLCCRVMYKNLLWSVCSKSNKISVKLLSNFNYKQKILCGMNASQDYFRLPHYCWLALITFNLVFQSNWIQWYANSAVGNSLATEYWEKQYWKYFIMAICFATLTLFLHAILQIFIMLSQHNFYTWHNSYAVLSCIKICCDLFTRNQIKSQRNFCQIWITSKQSSMEWVPGLF